jgi:hypothetical protein
MKKGKPLAVPKPRPMTPLQWAVVMRHAPMIIGFALDYAAASREEDLPSIGSVEYFLGPVSRRPMPEPPGGG